MLARVHQQSTLVDLLRRPVEAIQPAQQAFASEPPARSQTIIGEETLKQLELAGETGADLVIGCAGGGSNLAGLTFPFLRENLTGSGQTRIIAVEPEACPTLTRGEYRYDYGDTGGMTPLMKMYTLGHPFVPSPIHAGGLRYHAMAPLLSHAVHEGLIEAVALQQSECFEAGLSFARCEGIVPAPESAHAIAQAQRAAAEADANGTEPVIVIGLSGHGLLELGAYDAYLSGNLEDDELSDSALAAALAEVPVI